MKATILISVTLLALSSCSGAKSGFREATPPVAEKKDHIRIIHGDTVNDPYYWMYDFFGEGPDSDLVVEYLNAENDYADKVMAGTVGLQQKLFDELKGRIKEQDQSIPTLMNGYYYYTRTEEGKQYFKYCRKEGSLDAREEVLLDMDAMAEGHDYYGLMGVSVSPDNRLLTYSVDTVGRFQGNVYFKNLETDETYPEVISGVSGGATWANDNKTVFYVLNNPRTLLSEKVLRHELGTDPSADKTVYVEKDNTNYLGLYRSKDRRYILLNSESTLSSETFYIEADKPLSDFRSFQPRMADVLYSVTPLHDRFLVTTNLDAKNYRVMECLPGATGVENWKEYIPHRESVMIEYIEEFRNYLAICERDEGLLKIRVRDLRDSVEHYLDFGEPAYTAYTSSNPEYDTDMLRYVYTSMTTPSTTYDYGMATHEKTLLKQQEVVGGYDSQMYKTERVYATAADGVKVPVSLVYKASTRLGADTPLLLYGYGSYGSSMDASFSTSRLSLLDRGFVYAIAHIRGGEEMGRGWYEDGKMRNKINTFTDFISCAEYLAEQGYTGIGHIYASGASAGGLLMGAIVNMRPDLWNGIIADVPFVDVVNTMMDESIPLTTNEYDEWGNPADPDDYFYMKSYSPYENVERKDYPNMLVLTGLHDSQVQYFEPAKWVARLRDMKTDNNILLLRTNMNAGHGGASGRFEYLRNIALEYAFLLTAEGIAK